MRQNDMRKHCRVMVTGAGSGVGQGIVKALRASALPLTIIGADIKPNNAALFRTDEACIIPKVESCNAIEKIIQILMDEKIDVLFVGSEFELSFFASTKSIIRDQTGTLVIVSSVETVALTDDKWLTAEFLRKNKLPYAKSFLPSDIEDSVRISSIIGFPFILKSRKGTSSRNVHIINNPSELNQHFDLTPSPMIQELISYPSDDLSSEFTCSLFKDASRQIFGPFIARRTVKGGTSWQVEVFDNPALHQPLLEIGELLDFIGSINIQLMVRDGVPIPFELNARFSGTTAIRAHFGFNEPLMALLSFFYGEPIKKPSIRQGLAFRYHEEVFVEQASSRDCDPNIHFGTVNQWF